jgi:hypothetical protein
VSREEIVRVVNAASRRGLRTCWTEARRKGELKAGEHTFVLGWTIAPEGTVTEVQLEHANISNGSRLVACVSEAMAKWKFPKASHESLVRNYPLGPVQLR